MKKENFRISVPQPCQQDWDSMPRIGNGLYCNDCSKVVTDFTRFSDAELIALFSKKSSGGICGRFYAHQLENVYEPTADTSGWSLGPLKMILLGVLSFQLPLRAQVAPVTAKTGTITPQKKKATGGSTVMKRVKGRIVDSTTQARLKVQVYLGTKLLAVSDSAGFYEVRASAAVLKKKGGLTFFHQDYFQKRVAIGKGSMITQDVELEPKAFEVVTNSAPVELLVHNVRDVYVTGGIPVRFDDIIVRRRPVMGLVYRIRYKFRKWFKRS